MSANHKIPTENAGGTALIPYSFALIRVIRGLVLLLFHNDLLELGSRLVGLLVLRWAGRTSGFDSARLLWVHSRVYFDGRGDHPTI
jgi:hypothetical protein